MDQIAHSFTYRMRSSEVTVSSLLSVDFVVIKTVGTKICRISDLSISVVFLGSLLPLLCFWSSSAVDSILILKPLQIKRFDEIGLN